MRVYQYQPKEIRILQMEEMIDTKSYEQRKQREAMNGQNPEIQNLLGTVGTLLSLANNKGFQQIFAPPQSTQRSYNDQHQY
jgi:hypothetical protein